MNALQLVSAEGAIVRCHFLARDVLYYYLAWSYVHKILVYTLKRGSSSLHKEGVVRYRAGHYPLTHTFLYK